MGRIEDRLQELGSTLPAPMAPPGNFELAAVHGGIAHVAGHAPIDGSTALVQGAVGGEPTLDEGYRAAHARSAPGQGPSPPNVPVIVDAFVAVSE